MMIDDSDFVSVRFLDVRLPCLSTILDSLFNSNILFVVSGTGLMCTSFHKNTL
jgi:hypothetical protein